MSLNHGLQKYRESSRIHSKKDEKATPKKDEKPVAKAAAAPASSPARTAKDSGKDSGKNAVKTPAKTSAAKAAPAKASPAKAAATAKAPVKEEPKKAKAAPTTPAKATVAATPTAAAAAAAKGGKLIVSERAEKAEKSAKSLDVKGKAKAPKKVGDSENEEEEKLDTAATEPGEVELQAELEAEINEDAAQTSTLVKEDWSPVNSTRDRLVVEYAPLIKYIAQKIAARLPTNIELDDLISSGVIGLMDAIEKYDASRDNKFKTYAEFRIRGAILDELRAQDWVPRSVREKAKVLERCYARIEQQKGRQATDEEVCQDLGISQLEYHEMLNQVRSVSLLSFDDVSNFSKADKRALHGLGDNTQGRSPTPFNEVNTAALKRMIAEAINDLPEKQRLVLSLYYYEDLNLKEIGRVLDVTESRVSQLHTQAILRLKARLRTNWDDFVTLMGG